MRKMLVCAAIAASIAACGDDGDKTCDPVANTGCDNGQVCEEVPDGAPTCFAPVTIRGRVFDFATDAAIAGATVVGVDVNGAAITTVAVTDATGAYVLAVPTARAADGAPIGGKALTLRADATGYLTFPSGVRPALPIDTTSPALVDGNYVVQSTLTDVGLLPLPAGPATGMIHGRAAANDTSAGVLIVAEHAVGPAAPRGSTALADRDGDYRIFNLAPGMYTVTAYAKGHNYGSKTVDVAAGADVVVDLAVDSTAASAVSGSVQIVNGGGGTATSVILVVESTFDETLVRGESPAGMRAPSPGMAPDVTGAFRIDGVPAGRYVVLAAFENDHLVRDASSIGGTSIVHQAVTAGQDVTIAESFKVTGALDILGPGANGPEMVTGAPMLRWVDDSSEDRYDLTVFDAYGSAIWTHTEPGGSRDPSVPYGGPALTPGMYYQFRVLSIRDPAEEISRTEDLKGVFYLP
jgi:hypothetical protein